ncbi:MAG: EAL domain-containing protein [Gammaproteobacteria bacterium]|nr:EAL domain-containing protein [Gammaproteobacteria bacterium]
MTPSSLKMLVRKHPGMFIRTILPAAVIVQAFGLFQHMVVLRMSLGEVLPHMFIIPSLVGASFGFMIAAIRALLLEQQRQMAELAAHERMLEAEIEARRRGDAREQRLAFALDGASDGLWDWNVRTGEVYFSPRWMEMLSYRPDDVIGNYDFWARRVHADDGPGVFAALQEHLKGESEAFIQEFRLLGGDGAWLWVLARGKVVERDAEGSALRMVGTQTDVTLRRAAELALKTEKERAQITLASINDAVITTGADGRIDFMNAVAARLTGWSQRLAVGEPFATVCVLSDEDGGDRGSDAVQRCLRQRQPVELPAPLMLHGHDGRTCMVEVSVAPIRGAGDEIMGTVAILHDVSETHAMARQIGWQATHDALTGLVNRKEFERELQEVIAHAAAPDHCSALLYLDLDQFKLVNDTCGHGAGDELLRLLSQMLLGCIRQSDTLARLGGDEFGVILRGCNADQAREIADKLVETLRSFRFAWQERFFDVGASIGIVLIDDQTVSVGSAMSAADIACYAAKDLGRNRSHLYQPDDAELARRHGEMQWVSRIRHALEEDRFVLYTQPIEAIRGDAGAMHEILVRMRDEDGNLVPPGSFIPAAERYGLMPDVDRWVIGRAFAAMRETPSRLPAIALNLSGLSLTRAGMREFIIECQERCGIDPGRVCLEVTETAAIANLSHAIAFLAGLQARGFRFALDDFGSGLSSFAYLKNLPVDFLKIDGGFVRDMCTDPIDRAMVHAINEIGHTMGIRTIAEYVEDEATLAALRDIGVDYAQGHHIASPAPLEPAQPAINRPSRPAGTA